jgi:hypothetical protein
VSRTLEACWLRDAFSDMYRQPTASTAQHASLRIKCHACAILRAALVYSTGGGNVAMAVLDIMSRRHNTSLAEEWRLQGSQARRRVEM